MSADHYFSEEPTVASERSTVQLTLPDLTVKLQTDRGVFSGSRIDPGTKLLLLEAGVAPTGAATMLDVGCGYGPIALTLAHRNPSAQIWAIDTNSRARDLCAENATRLGFSHVTTVDPAAVPGDLRFDYICGNPPIRIGKKALHDLLTTWLSRLSDRGVAHLVVQKHLGSDSLAAWLERQGWPTSRLSSRAGYRILECRPRTGPAEQPAAGQPS